MARKIQEEEEAASIDTHDAPLDAQLIQDQKLAMEAQDAELARMLQEKERAKARRARERARQRKLERQQMQQLKSHNEDEKPHRPDKLELKVAYEKKLRNHQHYHQSQVNQLPQRCHDVEEIQDLGESEEEIQELPNVATIIDPTYNGTGHRSSSSSSSATVSPSYVLPTPPQELMAEDAPCYMPIQGQRRAQIQSPSLSQEEKHKRRVKDSCKTQ